MNPTIPALNVVSQLPRNNPTFWCWMEDEVRLNKLKESLKPILKKKLKAKYIREKYLRDRKV